MWLLYNSTNIVTLKFSSVVGKKSMNDMYYLPCLTIKVCACVFVGRVRNNCIPDAMVLFTAILTWHTLLLHSKFVNFYLGIREFLCTVQVSQRPFLQQIRIVSCTLCRNFLGVSEKKIGVFCSDLPQNFMENDHSCVPAMASCMLSMAGT